MLNPKGDSAMNECYFCQSIAGETKMGIIQELHSENFIFAWDHAPATPGHALIIPKRHVQFMRDLSRGERNELLDCAVRLKEYVAATDLQEMYSWLLTRSESDLFTEFMNAAIKKMPQFNRPPDAFNDGLNDGPAAGQTVPHFHWHVMPRWEGDVPDVIGGVRHIFPGMGNYKKGIQQ